MPRNRTSDDVDQIPADPAGQKVTKKAAPEPEPVPDYEPLNINDFTNGTGNLPPDISAQQPYEIFSLFFSEEQLQQLANHTNLYAERAEISEKPEKRQWFPTTTKELRAYIGVYVYMGLAGNRDTSVEGLWNTNSARSLHHNVRAAISLRRWQQIDRFFHISEGCEDTVFDQLSPLDISLREAFKKYWNTGTHLTVDETIQRFMGRAREVVNIPSKPTPEGYKIWVLANQGYVLDWMYHSKGVLGPIDLDPHWTKWLGFSKTQAVVLDLVN